MITRRSVLAGMAWLATRLGAKAGETVPPHGARDGFRFVQLSDLHCANVKVNPPPRFGIDVMGKDLVRSFELLDAAVREINEKVKPDFVAITGDLVDDWRDRESLARVKGKLDKLACPYYPVIGNHDGGEAWRQIFGPGRLNYAFRHGGWRFIAVDSRRGSLDNAALACLDRELRADTAAPTALLIHYPVVLPDLFVATSRFLAKSNGLQEIPMLLGNADEVRERSRKTGNLRAIFAGHTHFATECRVGEVLHFVAPALVAAKHAYSLVEIRGTEIRAELKALEP